MKNDIRFGVVVGPKFFYASLWLVCLLVCAAINLFYFPRTTIFPDEHRILSSAARLVTSGEFWVGADRAWEMPGAALFFAPFVRLFGADGAVLPIRFVQSLLLVVQSGLIALIAQRIFGKSAVAAIAAALVALYPFFLYYQGLLLSETLFITLLLGALAALYWWRDRGLKLDAALAVTCLFFAAATLTKATLTVLPPLLIAVTAWLAGAHIRRAFVILLAASCLYGVFMSPWCIRNAVVLGSFVPLTTGSAQNLYLGNNPANKDAGADWAHDAEPDLVARIQALPDEVDRQRAFGKAAVDYIEDNPAVFLRNAAKKFVRFWNLVPNATEFKSGAYSFISVASFGPVLVLAVIAAVRLWRRWRQLGPLYLIIGYFTAVHVVSIASLRYRLPIEPILILLAAEPLAAAFERLRPSRT